MANSTLKKVALYTLGAFSGALLTIGVQGFAASEGKKQDALPVQSIRTLAEVYSQIKANYYEDKTDDVLLESAAKGMVADLDPHSEYMNKNDYADLKESTSGEFGDGVSTRGRSVSEAVKKMRGKPGTNIELTISRKDSSKPLTFKLTRAIIKVQSVRSKLIEPGYGYIRISQFQERTVASLREAVQKLTKENKAPLQGLILDLRDDPGGLLNGAVGVSAAFLPEGAKVVSTKGRDGKDGMSLSALPKDYIFSGHADPLKGLPSEVKNIPLTVLINSGSASASEIVSGALQDHKRAVIVGTQSFGKGSVQTVLPLSNGSAIKLTTSLYYTPNDRSIQAQGIVPDVEVKDKNRTYESREADLAGHIGNPLGGEEVNGVVHDDAVEEKAASQADKEAAKGKNKGKDKEKEAEEELSSRHNPDPAKDAQLKAALDLVKDPAKWRESLGLAAKKPAKKDKKETTKEDK